MNILKQHSQKVFVFLSGLIIVTLPIKESYNSIAILLYTAYILYLSYQDKDNPAVLSRKVIILGLPFFYLFLQFFYSDFDTYQRNFLRMLPVIIFPLLFSMIKGKYKQHSNKILNILVFSAVAYSFFLIVVAFYRQWKFSPDFSDINWFFFAYHDFTDIIGLHPTYLGMYNCLAFGIIVKRVLTKTSVKVQDLVCGTILIIVMVLAGSRISLVCLILVFCYLMFSHLKKIKKRIKYILLGVFIGVPMLVFTLAPIAKERMIDMTLGLKEEFEYAKYGSNVKRNGSIGPRIELWRCAIQSINENPFFGNGYGNAQEELNACYLDIGKEEFAKLNYQTHNQYFSSLARGGIFGLLALLITLFYPFFYSISERNFLYAVFLIIVIVACFTENILNRHVGIVFFSFFNSFFFFLESNRNE